MSYRGEDLSSRQTEERRVVVDMVRSGDADTDAGVPLVGDFQEKTPGKGSRREGSGLDKQIQLFVEMSTPFFKASKRNAPVRPVANFIIEPLC